MKRYESIAKENGKVLIEILEFNKKNYWKSKIKSVHILCGKETEDTLFNIICKYSCPYCSTKLKVTGRTNNKVLEVLELLEDTNNGILKGLKYNLDYLQSFISDDKLIEHLIPLILEFKKEKD